MNQNKGMKIIAIIVIICIIIFGAYYVFGRKGNPATGNPLANPEEERKVSEILQADTYEKVDIDSMASAYDEIDAIYKGSDENEKVVGYAVFLTVEGYGGPMKVNVATDEKAEHVLKVQIGENQETEGVGSKVADTEFTDQFIDAALPLTFTNGDGLAGAVSGNVGELKDGTYEAKSEGFEGGYQSKVTLTIEKGKIVDVDWDEIDENGDSKKNKSIKGEYDMGNDGLRWHEQAEQMEQYLIELQEPQKIVFIDELGHIDTVSGVTIKVKGFSQLANECFNQARGFIDDGETRTVDAISGATISSTAVLNAVNIAAEFVSGNMNQ